ncbi:class II aldolase/adducin family protein [Jannaschia ovalis]|uniref:Class II aldolase/adducin family protein n=1 Tax=Jannaschia ovalis TaxID=3038773 RepID=A0ABY8LDN1_9RHOB|nr:class II aldolase/adducin family protein [Jannaschia sp. GRR-S6-38]WGH79261.1 class II aldolase/adducin family protein [Jannaschia sp. GRR-S6-38]
MRDTAEFAAFRALSARLGADPLQVQGPGGNTSIKDGDTMWIKASGTELAEAQSRDIFVAVDLPRARAEADGAGDGTCRAALKDADGTLRPSIETTFHAILGARVVAHTHSVATLTHAISAAGRAAAREKLADMPVAFVPYAKPGLPLTREIAARATSATRVIVLENHGLVCAGGAVETVSDLLAEVEARLDLPAAETAPPPTGPAPEGFDWAAESWIVTDPRAAALARAGSYWPDHVVFLGPALPASRADAPAYIVEGAGVAVRRDATPSQRAMLRCLSDVLRRLPPGWEPLPIGPEAEAALLDWDAEKYRQAMAARS